MQLNVRRRLADRISQLRKLVYAVSIAVVGLATAAVLLSISSPSSLVQVSTEPTFFEASRAFRTAREFAQACPQRAAGSPGALSSAEWVSSRLTALATPHVTQEFTAPLGDREATLRNVAVVLPGESPETVLVSAQRDPVPITDAASPTSAVSLADGTGTAILLDLIQVFAARPHEKTLVFLSSDGGGYGGLGVDHFLQNDPTGEDVRVILSIYGLGREERTTLRAGIEGVDRSTPGWYLQLSTAVLREAGLGLETPRLAAQVADHALALADGEQAAGLRWARPSLLLSDPGPGRVTSAALATQGAAVERIVLSLDAGTEVPADPGTAVVLSSGRYLTSRALGVLAALMLLPGVLMAGIWSAATNLPLDAWLRYVRNLLSFVLPLAVWLGLAWLASRAGLIPHYALTAPPDDPPLASPDYLVGAGLAFAGLVLFVLSRHFLGYMRPQEPLVPAETAKLSVGLAALVVGLALLASHSPFSLLTAITAAWLWPLATCFADTSRSPGRGWVIRRTNGLLLASGLAAPALLYFYLVAVTPLRWFEAWWWLLVQTVSGGYGLRGPIATVLITAAFLLLLGVRRLRLIPFETLEEPDDLALVTAPAPRVRKVKPAEERHQAAEK